MGSKSLPPIKRYKVLQVTKRAQVPRKKEKGGERKRDRGGRDDVACGPRVISKRVVVEGVIPTCRMLLLLLAADESAKAALEQEKEKRNEIACAREPEHTARARPTTGGSERARGGGTRTGRGGAVGGEKIKGADEPRGGLSTRAPFHSSFFFLEPAAALSPILFIFPRS